MLITREYLLELLAKLREHEQQHGCRPGGCSARFALYQELEFATKNWGRVVPTKEDLELAA